MGAVAAAALLALWAHAVQREAPQHEEDYVWQLPLGFPTPLVPADNPMSAAKVELGRYLFYDQRLSVTGAYSCASCHQQARAFTDGRPQAEGATGEMHLRSSMSLTNVAYNVTLTWADPELRTLEAQALQPMLNVHPIELGLAGHEEEVLARLRADPRYPPLFAAAFPEADEMSLSLVAKAIASFERILISGDSPYDRLVFRDEQDALDDAARRGLALFSSPRLACSQCHHGFNFSGPTDFQGSPPVAGDFHNTGLYNLQGLGLYPFGNRGLFETTGLASDMGRFRAPTLRNITFTAPYMHDGSIATLEEVIEHYAAGGRTLFFGPNSGEGHRNPFKSERVVGFSLTADEKSDLLAFLASLTDETFVRDPRFADPFS